MVDNTWDYRGTNPRQFETCSCRWIGVFRQIGHLHVEVVRIYIWLLEYQIGWSTCWSFSEVFTYVNNIYNWEFSKRIDYYYDGGPNANKGRSWTCHYFLLFSFAHKICGSTYGGC
jgi:hypothetical protein